MVFTLIDLLVFAAVFAVIILFAIGVGKIVDPPVTRATDQPNRTNI